MKKFSHIFLLFAAAVTLSWFLPWIYNFSLPDAAREPFVTFSPVSNSFVFTATGNDNKPLIYDMDTAGTISHIYTKNQRDSLLPQLYYRDLMAREELPESIAGHKVDMPLLRHAEMSFTSSPRDVNKRFPGVYLMMESMPARVDLENPKEAFRLDGSMEFVDMATNTVNPTRSERFTRALAARGFRFPAKWLNANPTARKQYDEGYLIIDADGTLFHVKQQAGRPYVARVVMPDSVQGRHAFILENTDRDYLGIVTDTADNLYFLMRDGYRLEPLPVGKVNASVDRMAMMGNMFNIVFRFSNAEGTRWRVIDRYTHRRLGSYDHVYDTPVQSIIGSYIFPFRLDFTSHTDSLAYPRLLDLSWHAMLLNLLLAAIIAATLRRRGNKPGAVAVASLATLAAGIFIFIPLLLIK